MLVWKYSPKIFPFSGPVNFFLGGFGNRHLINEAQIHHPNIQAVMKNAILKGNESSCWRKFQFFLKAREERRWEGGGVGVERSPGYPPHDPRNFSHQPSIANSESTISRQQK